MSFLLSPLRNGVCSSLHLPSAGLTRNFSAAASFRVARMTVIGRLGTAPEVTLTKSGNEVIKYVLGASYGPPNDRQTSWFRIACFAPKSTIVWDKTLSIEKGYVFRGLFVLFFRGSINDIRSTRVFTFPFCPHSLYIILSDTTSAQEDFAVA